MFWFKNRLLEIILAVIAAVVLGGIVNRLFSINFWPVTLGLFFVLCFPVVLAFWKIDHPRTRLNDSLSGKAIFCILLILSLLLGSQICASIVDNEVIGASLFFSGVGLYVVFRITMSPYN